MVSRVLGVVGAVLIPVAVLVGWVDTTVFDAGTMSERAVKSLDSEAVRHEVAIQLTDQLARRGNREAIAFRPGDGLHVRVGRRVRLRSQSG